MTRYASAEDDKIAIQTQRAAAKQNFVVLNTGTIDECGGENEIARAAYEEKII